MEKEKFYKEILLIIFYIFRRVLNNNLLKI